METAEVAADGRIVLVLFLPGILRYVVTAG